MRGLRGISGSVIAYGRKSRPTDNFSVDRSGLIGLSSELDQAVVDGEDDQAVLDHKEPVTELALDLQSYIQMRGPITLHDFVVQSSNNLIHGYYQNTREKIGPKGDFITAPEMSPLFGEMIGMWCISHWMSMGKPKNLNIIELGPGKGTLMKDIIEVAEKFPDFKAAVNVHLVELSGTMRKLQRDALQCPKPEKEEVEGGGEEGEKVGDEAVDGAGQGKLGAAEAKKSAAPGSKVLDGAEWSAEATLAREREAAEAEQEAEYARATADVRKRFADLGAGADGLRQPVTLESGLGVPVTWHAHLRQVPEPEDTPSLVIGQEFLDAFPVHQFVYTKNGWKEKLVDVDRASPSPFHFRIVLSPTATPAARTLLAGLGGHFREGDCVEIAPLALSTCEEIGARVVRTRGAALLIDYGENYPQGDTLRGFKDHQLVDYLSSPGESDVTADVDFDSCARAAAQSGAAAIGAIPQGEFLVRMGIAARAEQLIDAPNTTDDQAYELLASVRQLIDDKDMGKRFKVLTVLDPDLARDTVGFPPVEGSVDK
jgi:NADH dehydrogenase [ubiquinone] 1 alpha subcomplex assembly factor 7